MPTGFHWVIAPNQQLIPNLENYGREILFALQEVATFWGQSIQNEARDNAPWGGKRGAGHSDPTGNARSGLFFAVDGLGFSPITGIVTPEATSKMSDVVVESGDSNTLIITLGHTVFYGKFLELSNGGRYAIVLSTIEQNIGRLEQMIQDTFRG